MEFDKFTIFYSFLKNNKFYIKKIEDECILDNIFD